MNNIKKLALITLSLSILSCDSDIKGDISFNTKVEKGSTDLSYYGDKVMTECFEATIKSNSNIKKLSTVELGFEFEYDDLKISMENGPSQLTLEIKSDTVAPIKAARIANELISSISKACK